MKVDRAIQIKRDAIVSVQDLHSRAISYHLTNTEITSQLLKIYFELPKSAPSWIRTYLNGYHDCWRNSLYDRHLEFCYKVDGKLYSVNRRSKRYYENSFTPKELYEKQEASGHYWIDTDKPF